MMNESGSDTVVMVVGMNSECFVDVTGDVGEVLL